MFRIFLIFIGILFLFPVSEIFAQEEEESVRYGSSILNDTLASDYGPTTVQYFNASSIADNTNRVYHIDTSVYNLHQFSFVDYHNKKFQDLGNIGTAIRPIFYQFPQAIGRTTGFNIYDLYFKGAKDVRFYNTQSPYSRIGVVLGGEGRALTEAEYTRNIDYRSNIGFSYRGTFMDEQVERARRGDRNAEGVYYNFHGNYHTIDRKYWLLASFVRNNQEVDEYGGIFNARPNIPQQIPIEGSPFKLFYTDTIKVSFNNTRTSDLRRQYYIYHEYHISDYMQVFHEFEHYDQLVKFYTNTDADPERRVLPSLILRDSELARMEDTTAIGNRNKFDEWSNKIGISGTVGEGFYKLYYQRRNLDFDYSHLNFDFLSFNEVQQENLAGIMMRIGEDPERQLQGKFDYLEGGYYDFFGRISYAPFYGSVQQMKRKPAVLEAAFRGPFNSWKIEDLKDPVTSEIIGGVKFSRENILINGSLTFQRLTDQFYFTRSDERTVGRQNNGTVTALMPKLEISKWWGDHWLTKGEVIYSRVGGDNPEVYPLPDLFTNAQVSYHNISFNGNLEWQLGVDFHWKSAYKAPGYDPLVQQFYIQDNFITPGAPIIDIFLNAKINRGRIFVKYINLFQALEGYGHMPTPYYPGQVATLDFGFNWSFYD
ncbi:MAG: putative porin [Candidatus Cyclobacteriaceae bacterium M2_1C_046]